MIEWLPEFALTSSERENIGAYNAVACVAKAARSIYTSNKYQRRGELGELILHALLRQVFKTVPAISKFYYKDSANDTVKGFDAVHVVATETNLQLWLGEVKFYDNISKAISDVVAELNNHSNRDYLRSEFSAITNKIDATWPHATRLEKLLHRNTSLDEIFNATCIPVLLTYNSPTVCCHTDITDKFKIAFEQELLTHRNAFASKFLPGNLKIYLFLFPLKSKEELITAFDDKLKHCQSIL